MIFLLFFEFINYFSKFEDKVSLVTGAEYFFLNHFVLIQKGGHHLVFFIDVPLGQVDHGLEAVDFRNLFLQVILV